METNKFIVEFLKDLSRLSANALDNPELYFMPQRSPAAQQMTRAYSWFSAFISNDTEMMLGLLAHGMPVDVLHPLRHTTALMEAARLGRTDMVEWLIEHGADADRLCGKPRGTALHIALRRQHYGAAQSLVIAMYHCAITDEQGATPLHTLCVDLSDEFTPLQCTLAEACIAKGCPLDALDHEGATALHYCAINASLSMAEILLAAGANPNAVTTDGYVSPLMIAALEKNPKMAQLLLSYGADMHQRTREGSSPAIAFPAIKQMQVGPALAPRTHILLDS